MSSKRVFSLYLFCAVTVAMLAGCGRKEAPKPPIQIIPAQTVDFVVQQRGSDLQLHLSYPHTTISGTALGGISAVELWEFNRKVPIANFVAPEEESEAVEGAEGAISDEEADGEQEPVEEEQAPVTEEDGDDAESEEPEPRVVTLDRIADSAIEYPEGMYRLEDLVVPDPAEFAATAVRLLVLQGPELDTAISGDRIRTRIHLPELEQREELEVHAYAVKTISNTGRGSAFSNLAWIVRRDPPPPPTEFEVRPKGDGIELRWFYAGKGPAPDPALPADGSGTDATSTAPAAAPPEIEVEEIVDDHGVEAFHVYRRSARSPHYDAPLRRIEKGERVFLDNTAAFGESYIYAVAAVLRNGPLVESALSTEREVDYEDRFAPAPPRNLVTFADRSSVRILWDASETSDVAGYFVERRMQGSAEWEPLNTEAVVVLEYTDSRVASGRTYFYRVLAVDRNGLRGDPSPGAEARVP